MIMIYSFLCFDNVLDKAIINQFFDIFLTEGFFVVKDYKAISDYIAILLRKTRLVAEKIIRFLFLFSFFFF